MLIQAQAASKAKAKGDAESSDAEERPASKTNESGNNATPATPERNAIIEYLMVCGDASTIEVLDISF
jgi:hypothetical protein